MSFVTIGRNKYAVDSFVAAEIDTLRARVEELTEALEWYAHQIPANYEIHEGGLYLCAADSLAEKARAALAGSKP